ncbi:MAG: B12-binding domain-containing radical SAM protein [Planctomycetaceae bacterium]|nr:B12-binding domain-containing radical SAM protein [Planctomycetaceae bacterium]
MEGGRAVGRGGTLMGASIHLIYLDIDTGFYPGAHHGLASLIGAVRADGHRVRLTHLARAIGEDEFLAAVTAEPADAYGFSAMTNQFKHVRRLAPVLAATTGKPIVVGGVHATLAPQEAAAIEGVTCACRGEGERFLPAWLDALAAGGDGRSVKGCCYSDAGRFVSTRAEDPRDLDALPAPCYDDFDMSRIVHDLGGRLSVVVSRGCPFRCAFCCNEALRKDFDPPQSYVRFRTPASAVALTADLARRHAARSIRFEDDLLLLNARWRGEFLDLYRRTVNLPFECNCRADMVSDELAAQLAAARCISVDIGIETGDQALRESVLGKRISNEQIVSAFDTLHRHGLHTYAYNMIGLPTETVEMAWRTYALNCRVKPSAGAVFYFYPYPRTELHERARRENLLLEDYERADGYTQRPSVRQTHMTHAAMRRVYRRLRAFLYLQRLRTFFPLPRWLKAPAAAVLGAAMRLCPPLVDAVTAQTPLKRWLRRMAFKV